MSDSANIEVWYFRPQPRANRNCLATIAATHAIIAFPAAVFVVPGIYLSLTAIGFGIAALSTPECKIPSLRLRAQMAVTVALFTLMFSILLIGAWR